MLKSKRSLHFSDTFNNPARKEAPAHPHPDAFARALTRNTIAAPGVTSPRVPTTGVALAARSRQGFPELGPRHRLERPRLKIQGGAVAPTPEIPDDFWLLTLRPRWVHEGRLHRVLRLCSSLRSSARALILPQRQLLVGYGAPSVRSLRQKQPHLYRSI